MKNGLLWTDNRCCLLGQVPAEYTRMGANTDKISLSSGLPFLTAPLRVMDVQWVVITSHAQ